MLENIAAVFPTITLTPRINFSFRVSRLYKFFFCLFGVCGNNIGFTLILYRGVHRQSSSFAFSDTKTANPFG